MNESNEESTSNCLAEINGQLLALTILIGKLLEVLVKNGIITQQQAETTLYHSDLRAWYVCQTLKDTIPPDELRRIERQADRTLTILSTDIIPK